VFNPENIPAWLFVLGAFLFFDVVRLMTLISCSGGHGSV